MYDTSKGLCIGIHAEGNAIIYGDYDRLRGGTLYVNDEPCLGCSKLIAGAGIARVVWSAQGRVQSRPGASYMGDDRT
jgi:deoxycytidylate deaminase